MSTVSSRVAAAAAAGAALLPGGQALAHGFAGDRFFPATIQTDDPFVADEATAGTLTKNPTDPTGGQSYSYEFDIREFHRWRIVNPQDIHPKLEQEARDAEKQAQAAKEAAARFRRLWIEKTDKTWRKPRRLFGLK